MFRSRPGPVTAIAIFFLFGTSMSALAAILLLIPGTPLDSLWAINPRAHEAFLNLRPLAILMMVVLSVVCALAAMGLWRLRVWGLAISVAVLSINLIGDSLNAILLHDYRALIGLPVGGLMVGYLVRKRRLFE